ncbi:clarin-3-like isoform X2 [Branchiostoma lanceolatum]|uniref:clarin-3-like isoform X2 n=1 Tax=Branchiostoma lanceolatum TaxID=7740 RepID=UPI0034568A81
MAARNYKKVFYAGVLLLSLGGAVMLATSLGTDFWVRAEVKRDLGTVNVSQTQGGTLNIGLFRGCKTFPVLEKCGFQVTEEDVGRNITYQPSHPMVAATIAFNAGAILMGLIAVSFSAYNVFTNPIETFAGPMGLYIWNGVSAVFCLVCLILYAVLYHLYLSGNSLLTQTEIGSKFYVETSGFGYSYWLVVGALAAFLVNEGLVYLSGKHIRSVFQNRSGSMKERPSEDVLMY